MHKANKIFIEDKQGHLVLVQNNILDKKIEPGEYDITLRLRGRIHTVSPTGTVLFETNQYSSLYVEKPFSHRTTNQNSTLRGIEYFIGYVLDAGPPEKSTLELIHESLLEEYAPKIISPITGESISKRTSSMSTKEMSVMIDKALSYLGTLDIPYAVMEAIGQDMKVLWEKWYLWKNSQDLEIFIPHDTTWEQYKILQPVCEFTFKAPGDGVKLDMMHIVSRGSDSSAIDEPWNWIRGLHDIHRLQHEKGWDYILRQYPHIAPKVNRAIEIAKKRKIEWE